MREIKFRVWDWVEKQMCHVIAADFQDIKAKVFCRLPKSGTQGIFSADLMQYIGAKDKNGVEIYEGDIIRSPAGKDYWIRWSELTYRFVAEPIPANRLEAQLVSRTISNYEVVGNIHESPEFANWEGTKID